MSKATCQCWCGRRLVDIPWSEVGRSTLSCGLPKCVPGTRPVELARGSLTQEQKNAGTARSTRSRVSSGTPTGRPRLHAVTPRAIYMREYRERQRKAS